MSPNVFCRREQKYLLSREQKQALITWMEPYLRLDEYGRTNVRSIYYDTDSWLLIRRSLEGGIYREKIRLRSYGKISEDQPVFVELKKKFDSIVYKRRVQMPLFKAENWLAEKLKLKSVRFSGRSTMLCKPVRHFIRQHLFPASVKRIPILWGARILESLSITS